MTSLPPKTSAGPHNGQPRPREIRQGQDEEIRRRFTPFETIASIETAAESRPDGDVVELAGLAFELLNGARFDPSAFDFAEGIRNERIREALPDVTAQFARVISDGTNHAFSSNREFIAALDSAAIGSADDLAAAAHQAISAKDASAAELFLSLGRRYAPDHAELAAAALRLAPAVVLGQSQNSLFADDAKFDPESEQARFLAALKASIPEYKPKKSKSPWLAIAAAMLGMLALMAVLGVVVLQAR